MSALDVLINEVIELRVRAEVAREGYEYRMENLRVAEEQLLKALHPENKYKNSAVRVQVQTNLKPSVHSWKKFLDYVIKTGSFELLLRGANSKSIRKRWKNGEVVPGVVSFPVTSLKITGAASNGKTNTKK